MKKMNYIGMLIVLGFCLTFFALASFFLEKNSIKNKDKVNKTEEIVKQDNNYENEKNIISRLYSDARILYDVVVNTINDFYILWAINSALTFLLLGYLNNPFDSLFLLFDSTIAL